MSQFFNEFEGVNKDKWVKKLKEDLKGKPVEGNIIINDDVEEIEYKSFQHFEDRVWTNETPGSFPYLRTGKYENNQFCINNIVPGETPESINKNALSRLMKGASGIRIDLKDFSEKECEIIIKEIGVEYVNTTFICNNKVQFDWLKNLSEQKKFYALSAINNFDKTSTIPSVRNFEIDASIVQKAGGNCTQEIAYALKKGHDKLFELMESGLSIDDAAPHLKFKLGIGSNFFFEIAKFRVFRRLWAEIVEAYKAKHDCTAVPFGEAETTSLNKSLKDPYTNLLRLTTESLSAVIGGIDELTMLPFDWRSDSKLIEKHQRLVNNIPLILHEESYMSEVIDPAGGSYSIEQITQLLMEKSWEKFQNFKEGLFLADVAGVAARRIKKTESKSFKLVGINHFLNEKGLDAEWENAENYSVGRELILERDCKIEN